MNILRPIKTTCMIAAFCVAATIASSAQTFIALRDFGKTNGASPNAALIQGTNGNFYGTTAGGGSNQQGTVYELTPAGKLTTLYSFCSQANCSDGADPYNSALVQGANGNFYGTTAQGGITNAANCSNGCGTVFEITATGALTTLYDFCSQANCADGYSPHAGLVEGPNGNFYGTTISGGTGSGCINQLCGTIFEITPAGKLTTLYNFCSLVSCTDGGSARQLILGTNGSLYGLTGGGGGHYTIFEFTPANKFITLAKFTDSAADALLQGADGNLYGTQYGTTKVGGTFFQLVPGKEFTILYQFPSGENPDGLIQATDGNFYGSTLGGGLYGAGALFEITPTGSQATLYNFCSQTLNGFCLDGAEPDANLLQATSGTFYGTDFTGGYEGDGVAFSLSMELGPFVAESPFLGKAGQVVRILGNNLTGSSSVTFNGTPATFDVVSNTYISAKVPAGATTGTIEVTTPSGTLSSNVAFTVLP